MFGVQGAIFLLSEKKKDEPIDNLHFKEEFVSDKIVFLNGTGPDACNCRHGLDHTSMSLSVR